MGIAWLVFQAGYRAEGIVLWLGLMLAGDWAIEHRWPEPCIALRADLEEVARAIHEQDRPFYQRLLEDGRVREVRRGGQFYVAAAMVAGVLLLLVAIFAGLAHYISQAPAP